MTCAQALAFKDAYCDRELDLARSIDIEEHLRTCLNCRRAFDNVNALKAALKSDRLNFQAPPSLARQIRAALPAPQPGASWRWRRFTSSWLGLALPISAAAVLAVLIGLNMNGILTPRPLREEVISSHIRSLMANHLTDVASSDQHTVKPWFSGKLDFAPQVTDLASQGFSLVGGRMDYVQNRPVAALVYQRRKHLINVFTWPARNGQTAAGERLTAEHGFNFVRWRQAGMDYCAVSDLNGRELLELVQALQAAQSQPRQ